jgi:hypothetical protein
MNFTYCLKLKLLTTLLFLYLSIPGYSQNEKNIDDQTVAWAAYFGTHKLSDQWSLWTELQIRRAEFVNEWKQVLPRVGLNYHLNNNVILTIGYAYLWTYPYGVQPIPLDGVRYEHRPWQQVTLLHESGNVKFQHRFRLEQRFLQNWTAINPDTGLRQITDGYELQNRMRYRMLLSLPLTKNSNGEQKLFATIYDEIFINFGDNIGFNLFDQNRIGGTLGFQVSPKVNFQVGYMNQVIQKPNGRDIENNHALTLFIIANSDFLSK